MAMEALLALLAAALVELLPIAAAALGVHEQMATQAQAALEILAAAAAAAVPLGLLIHLEQVEQAAVVA